MTEPSDDAQMVALGVHPREGRVVVYRGENSISYLLTFEGVRGDDLTVKSEVHRMWFEMFGWKWIVVEADSEEGAVLEQTVEDLSEGSDMADAFCHGLVDLGGSECNHCGHVFAEGSDSSGGKLGPTCPECGHPANDPKIRTE